MQLVLISVQRITRLQTVDVFNGNSQAGVREHPERNQPCAESLVRIVQGWFFGDIFNINLGNGSSDSFLEGSINILLDFGCVFNDSLRILCFGGRNRWQSLRFVTSFRTPRYIVQVTEGVDIQNIGETGSQAQVLEETREHVPRVALEPGIRPMQCQRVEMHTYKNDAMKQIPNVETMAAIRAPTGGLKNVKTTCIVVLFLRSLGMAYSPFFSAPQSMSKIVTTDLKSLASKCERTDNQVYSEESVDPAQDASVIQRLS